MNKLLKRLGVTTAIMGLALTPVGLVSANSSIGTTGPDSTNKIELSNEAEYAVQNNNNLSATNNNPQDAESGNAKVRHNTEGGDAESGQAKNTSTFKVTANVDNSGSSAKSCGCGTDLSDIDATISRTGPDSYNKIEVSNSTSVEVENNNNISVTNNNTQNASSGNARVSGNTEGGNATSGDAVNTSTTTVDLKVKN